MLLLLLCCTPPLYSMPSKQAVVMRKLCQHSQLCAAVDGAQQQHYPVRPGQVCGRRQLEGEGHRLLPAQHTLCHRPKVTTKG